MADLGHGQLRARAAGEPEFEAKAAAEGIRSCLALPLSAGGQPIGAINLYAQTASAFGTAEARRAENFAKNASGTLTLATRLASHAVLIDQLRSSLASRTVIDQALGIIMARERCTQSHAFALRWRDFARASGDEAGRDDVRSWL